MKIENRYITFSNWKKKIVLKKKIFFFEFKRRFWELRIFWEEKRPFIEKPVEDYFSWSYFFYFFHMQNAICAGSTSTNKNGTCYTS